MTQIEQNVTINTVNIPDRPGLRTKDNHFPNLGGNRKPDSKWKRLESSWPTVFEEKETMTLAEFRSRYSGLLRAHGFSSNYAKKCVTDYALNNGPVWAGIITISDSLN